MLCVATYYFQPLRIVQFEKCIKHNEECPIKEKEFDGIYVAFYLILENVEMKIAVWLLLFSSYKSHESIRI